MRIYSINSLSASVAPTMVPILVRAGFRPSMAAASVGASVGSSVSSACLVAFVSSVDYASSSASWAATAEASKLPIMTPRLPP